MRRPAPAPPPGGRHALPDRQPIHHRTRRSPADLGALRAAGAHDLPREPAEVSSLLQACLEYRFATDVAIGDPPAASPYDIALADHDQSG